MIKTKLYENIMLPKSIRIKTPKNGFTRYLAQCKEGEPYIESDMRKNFIFYEPFNNKVFQIFEEDIEERYKLYENWNENLNNDDMYICQNFEFVSDFHQNEIDNIFENPTKELAKALQDIAGLLLIDNPKYEICIGVVHGKQLTESGVRYPHAHILLRKKVKK